MQVVAALQRAPYAEGHLPGEALTDVRAPGVRKLGLGLGRVGCGVAQGNRWRWGYPRRRRAQEGATYDCSKTWAPLVGVNTAHEGFVGRLVGEGSCEAGFGGVMTSRQPSICSTSSWTPRPPAWTRSRTAYELCWSHMQTIARLCVPPGAVNDEEFTRGGIARLHALRVAMARLVKLRGSPVRCPTLRTICSFVTSCRRRRSCS